VSDAVVTELDPYDKLAEVYDSIYPRKFYEDYYCFISRILEGMGSEPETVLELACGTGNLAKVFLDRGYSVEGFDMSGSMLSIARKKGLRIYRGDMADFELNKDYDLILCVFGSMNYIKDQSDLQRCFCSVSRHLARGGLFIFDINSDYRINELVPGYHTEYHKVYETEVVMLNSHEPDSWVTDMLFFVKTEDGKYQRFHERHVERAYKLDDVKSLLEKAGLEIVGSYSDFEFNEIA
jgi:SAM-dependent methyltransferase